VKVHGHCRIRAANDFDVLALLSLAVNDGNQPVGAIPKAMKIIVALAVCIYVGALRISGCAILQEDTYGGYGFVESDSALECKSRGSLQAGNSCGQTNGQAGKEQSTSSHGRDLYPRKRQQTIPEITEKELLFPVL